MKKEFFAILAVLMVFAMVTTGCDDGSSPGTTTGGNDIAVTFSGVTANGSTTASTTQLTLTFSAAIDGLTADDISLTGVTGITKGALDSTAAPVYKLPVTVTAGGTLNVAVAKKGYDISGSPLTVTINYLAITEVTFVSVTANGNATTNTTQLTLTFSEAITGLTATNITLSGVTGITKGTLDSTAAPVYTLPISGFTTGGPLTVAVARNTFDIKNSPQTVAIYYIAGPFDLADGTKVELAVSGASPITVDTTTGIISSPVDDTYGNLLNVTVPADLSIIASDTIVIKYIGIGNAPLTPKMPNTYNDIDPKMDGAVFTGDETIQTLEIQAVRYGASIPPTMLTFQSRPTTTEWKLKIISITVTAGDPIKVTSAVTGIKPASGGNPVTTLDTLQYSGTVTWKDADDTALSGTDTFTAGIVYTATITLTKKAGYTFDGITADTFPVTGTDTVTHATGTDTLTITAVFPATVGAAPDKILTFVATDKDVNVKGRNGSISIEAGDADGGNGFTYTQTGSWESAFAYFKVTFAAGYKLSDYSKISYKISGDSTYKPFFINAYASEADIDAITGNLPTADQIAGGEWGVAGWSTANSATEHTLTITHTSADGNEVWIAVRTHAPANSVFKLTDIKFHNDK
jgi:hypothetical protein